MRIAVLSCLVGSTLAACGGAAPSVKPSALKWEMVNVPCPEMKLDEVVTLNSAAEADALRASGSCPADAFSKVDWTRQTVVGVASLGNGCKVNVLWTARRDGDDVLLGHVMREDGSCEQANQIASFLILDKVQTDHVKVTRRRTKREEPAPTE